MKRKKKNIEPTPRSSIGADDDLIIDMIILKVQLCQKNLKFKIDRFLRSDL